MINYQRNDIEHIAAYKRDSELVKSSLEGDSKSFARLMTLYKKRIVAIGMSFFKNTEDVEDFFWDTQFSSFEECQEWGLNHDCTHIYDDIEDRFYKMESED